MSNDTTQTTHDKVNLFAFFAFWRGKCVWRVPCEHDRVRGSRLNELEAKASEGGPQLLRRRCRAESYKELPYREDAGALGIEQLK